MIELQIPTKAEAARRIGISRSYLGNIINHTAPTQSGDYDILPDTAQSIVRGLEVSPEEVAAAIGYLPDSDEDKLLKELIRRVKGKGLDGKDLSPDEQEEYLTDAEYHAEAFLRRVISRRERGQHQ